MSTLSERLLEIVKKTTNEYRRFKELELATGVQGDTWKSWFHGRQRPTAEMIEMACKTWPKYAFWLTTGIDDFEHGHTRVFSANSSTPRERTTAQELFQKEIEYAKWRAQNPSATQDAETEKIDQHYLAEIWRLTQLRVDQQRAIEKLEENTDLASYLAAKKNGKDF